VDINRTNLEALFKSIVKGFQDGMAYRPPVDLGFLTSAFGSTTAANYYPFLEQIPGFREWIGDREFQNLRSQKFEVANRDFELSLVMPDKDLQDDQYGMYVGLTQQVAAGWPVLLYELLVEVLTNRVKAWDGYYMLSDSHVYGSNSIDNYTTDSLSATSFEAALVAAGAWKFSNDKPCRTQFTHLLYGPKNEQTVFDLIKNEYVVSKLATGGTADYVGGAVKNRNFGRVTPVLIPDFIGDYDDYWVLLDCSKPIKPVLLQTRKTPTVTMTTDPERIAEQGLVKIMADGRAAAAPTFFHLAYGGVL